MYVLEDKLLGKIVGVVCIEMLNENSIASIGPVAVHPNHQAKEKDMVQRFLTLLSHWPKSHKLTVFHAELIYFHSMKKEVTLKSNEFKQKNMMK